MKIIKRLLKWFLIGFVLLIIALYIFDYDYLITAVRTIYAKGHNTAYLHDYQAFNNRVIEKSDNPEPWAVHKEYNKVAPTEALTQLHKEYGTVAFLIIKNDSIWDESYYDNYDENSKSNSFSMAKSIISAMLGSAIMNGDIKNIDQPVGDFFEEFKEGLAAKLTVGDLASMASGLNWDEAYYSPFSITTKAYFYDDLRTMMRELDIIEEPGKKFKYLSGNTELLGMVIEKATGTTLSEYLHEKFWNPMGAENDAFWQLDTEEGFEKAYCCVASNARDFARFGKLYKQYGKWNGKQLLDSSYVAMSIKPRFPDSPQYGYSWWLSNHLGKQIYYMRGHLGQYVIVIPEDDLIIVRLGHRTAPKDLNDPHTADFYGYINETYKMFN
ncbi:serine hydrolase [Leptobacterium sp. I13]|uniref:serine hydrolase domain-containing protein n=1 Tax=Leptobacterium meishanense TaxID=3128904 RepID=UPI0030ECA253